MSSDTAPDPHGAHEPHASVGFYWMIAAILGVITGIEVAIFYIPAIGGALVPSLLLLSATKFLLVVMFFMHLKFDSKVFTGLFLAGDFNQWRINDESRLARFDNGKWEKRVNLSPGRYRYKFVVDGRHWMQDPRNPQRAANAFGTHDSLLVVE